MFIIKFIHVPGITATIYTSAQKAVLQSYESLQISQVPTTTVHHNFPNMTLE